MKLIMKYIPISIFIIIFIILIYKKKETFSIFYNKDDESNKIKSFEAAIDLKNKLINNLLIKDDISDLKNLESNASNTKDYIEQINTKIDELSKTTLKNSIKSKLQNDSNFMESIKGDQGEQGESGVSDLNTNVIAKNLKINEDILDRTHINYINDYHSGDLNSLYGNSIDVRKDKKAIYQSLNGALYTDEFMLGSLDENLSIRNEDDAIHINKLNADLFNVDNNNIYSDSNNKINIDKVEVDNLNVENGLNINGKSIFDMLKGAKGSTGDVGAKSILPDKVSIESDQLKLKYYGKNKQEEYDIFVDGKINRLTGPKGYRGVKGDTGATGDSFKLPTKITHNNDTITFETEGLPSFNVTGSKGDKGPKGIIGSQGATGDHGVYPIDVKKNGKTLTFVFNDPKYNKQINKVDDFKGDQGLQGEKGIDGVNFYEDSLKFNDFELEFTKNITLKDAIIKYENSDVNLDVDNLKKNDLYVLTLARYLGIPTQFNINNLVSENNDNINLHYKNKENLKGKIKTKIINLLGRNINIYDFFSYDLNIDNIKYKLKQIIDIAKILDIEIDGNIQPNIITKIKSRGGYFTQQTTFKNIVENIESNKEFIYIYKSFGDKLYFNATDLTLREMKKGFNNIDYDIDDIKNNLKKIDKIILHANKFFKYNTFFYELKNGKYEAITNFIDVIDTELSIFNLTASDFTLEDKLYILNNFKLGHQQDCNNAEKCRKYCRERYDNIDEEKFSSSDFTCNSPISASKEIDMCSGGRKNYSYSIIPDPMTKIYPTLDDLTKDAIFELNANKQNFLENQLIVDFKSRMIFKMKNENNEVINNIKTENLKTINRMPSLNMLNYWDLKGNYLETNVDKYKLTHDTKKLSGYTQIFVLKFANLINLNLINYVNKNKEETFLNPLFIKDNKFCYIDNNNNIEEYSPVVNKTIYEYLGEANEQIRYFSRIMHKEAQRGYHPLRQSRNSWMFLAIKFKKEINDETQQLNCDNEKVKTEIFLSPLQDITKYNYIQEIGNPNNLNNDLKPIEPIIESFMSLDHEPIYYHKISKPLGEEMGMQEPGFFMPKNIPSNEGFDLSMMFSFNKALSNIRINKIFRKIKEDYFTIDEMGPFGKGLPRNHQRYQHSLEASPPDIGQMLPPKRQTPPHNREVPPSNREIPPAYSQMPPPKRQTPPHNREVPPSNREIPPAYSQMPSPKRQPLPPYKQKSPPRAIAPPDK